MAINWSSAVCFEKVEEIETIKPEKVLSDVPAEIRALLDLAFDTDKRLAVPFETGVIAESFCKEARSYGRLCNPRRTVRLTRVDNVVRLQVSRFTERKVSNTAATVSEIANSDDE